MVYLRQQSLVLAALYFCLAAAIPTTANASIPAHRNDTSPITFANSLIKPWGMRIDGSAQGLLIDVQRALAIETKHEHQVFLQPYSRVIHTVYSGDVDMAILFDARVDLSRVIKIAHVTESPVIIIGKAGTPPITSIDELQGKLVGHMRGSKYGPAFDAATHFEKVPINAMSQGLAMLTRGRIEAMTGVDLTFYWAIKQMQLSPSDFSPLFVVSKPTISLYISKKSEKIGLIPTYRRAMQTLHKNGVIEEIFGHNTDWNQMDGWSKPWQPTTVTQSSNNKTTRRHRQ